MPLGDALAQSSYPPSRINVHDIAATIARLVSRDGLGVAIDAFAETAVHAGTATQRGLAQSIVEELQAAEHQRELAAARNNAWRL